LDLSLATETEAVRSKLAAYGNDLISLGVDGFRLDAAKHIDPSDVKDILGRLTKDVYTTQEVAFGANVRYRLTSSTITDS
jgi:glycosidase